MDKEWYDSKLQAILEGLKGKKIILYGAGSVGRQVKAGLEQNSYTCECFIDKEADTLKLVEGLIVRSVESLVQFNDARIVIIICISTKEYLKQCIEYISKYAPRASWIIFDRELLPLMLQRSCSRRIDSGEDLDLLRCYKCLSVHSRCNVFNRYLMRKNSGKTEEVGRKFEQNFGLILSSNCTLRCKNCIEMIPYYQTRIFYSGEQIISDCRKVLDSCQFMPIVSISGGEPFLHNKLPWILSELLSMKKIGIVVVVTNGTVVPDTALLSVLKNNRIIVELSNYSKALKGKLLYNTQKTKALLEEHAIQIQYSETKLWLEHNYTPNNLEDRDIKIQFQKCLFSDCHVLSDGILYRCQHQMAGVQLGKFPLVDGEYVDVRGLDLQELRDACDRLEQLESISACRYCSFLKDAITVPAAEQLE